MLEKLSGLPEGVEGLKAVGKVTKEDYAGVFEPMLAAARHDRRRLRLLYQFGPEFEGFTPGGAWEDALVGVRAWDVFDGCAIVSDVRWIGEAIRAFRFMMPFPIRSFLNADYAEAAAWLGTLPEPARMSYQLLSDAGVIVVELKEALRAQDFDALADSADAWIETHGELQGLVIHARQFPGWQDLGGLIRHVRFVRDHQRKIRRIALCADFKLATVAPAIADHFVRAEIRAFPYSELDAAVSWARGSNATASGSVHSA